MIAPGLDRGLAFEGNLKNWVGVLLKSNTSLGDENQKESSKKDSSVFNIEDMMAPIDDTFDFLNVKTRQDDVAKDMSQKTLDTKGEKEITHELKKQS